MLQYIAGNNMASKNLNLQHMCGVEPFDQCTAGCYGNLLFPRAFVGGQAHLFLGHITWTYTPIPSVYKK
jgi:hypothetical protein